MPRPGTLRGGSRVAWKHTAPYLVQQVWKKAKAHIRNYVILGGMYGQKLVKYILGIVRLRKDEGKLYVRTNSKAII